MKLIIILLLFPFVTWGQNLFPSKGVRRTTTPNNGKFVDSPSFNSESRTISNKATKEKTNYKIYTKEYVDQKHIPDEFELTEFANPAKGSTVSWILTPDTSNFSIISFSTIPKR